LGRALPIHRARPPPHVVGGSMVFSNCFYTTRPSTPEFTFSFASSSERPPLCIYFRCPFPPKIPSDSAAIFFSSFMALNWKFCLFLFFFFFLILPNQRSSSLSSQFSPLSTRLLEFDEILPFHLKMALSHCPLLLALFPPLPPSSDFGQAFISEIHTIPLRHMRVVSLLD